MNEYIYHLVKFLIPISIILIELAIGFQLYHAKWRKQDADDNSVDGVRPTHWVPIFLWSIVGFVFASVLPAITLALIFASSSSSSSTSSGVNNSASNLILAISVGILSFMSHGYLVFSGEQTQVSKEFVTYKIKRRKLVKALIRLNNRFKKLFPKVTLLLNKYISLINSMKSGYSAAIPKAIKTFLIKHFGYDPFGGTAPPNGPGSNDSQAGASGVLENIPLNPNNSSGGQQNINNSSDNSINSDFQSSNSSTHHQSSSNEDEHNNNVQPLINVNEEPKENSQSNIETPENYLQRIIESQIRSNENKVKP